MASTRPLRHYTAYRQGAVLGKSGGTLIITARTKAAAARQATEVTGSVYWPTEFGEAMSTAYEQIRYADLLDAEGTVLVYWDTSPGGTVERWTRNGFEIVGHFRRDEKYPIRTDFVGFVAVHVDPLLLSTRLVTIAKPIKTGEIVGRGVCRNEYPSGVFTDNARDDQVFVAGMGQMGRAVAEELMRGLAGALHELDQRP
jgi:hypothetical protein